MVKNKMFWMTLMIMLVFGAMSVMAADPTIGTPVISPTTAYTLDDLVCNATGVVPELDTNTSLTIEWFWYKGTVFQSGGNISVLNNTNTAISTIADALTTKADVWNCTVRATNGTAWSAFESVKLTISNTVPVFTEAAPDVSLSHSVNFNSSINITDADSDTLTYYLNDTMIDIVSSTGYLSDNPTQAQAGVYSMTINATDGTGWVSDVFTYTITNAQPAFTQAPPDVSLFHNVNFNSSINVTDADGDTLIYYVSGTVINIVSSTGYLSDNPTQAEVGNYTITVNATDGARWVTDDFVYEIKNNGPVFTQSPTAATLYHSNNLALQLNATDVESDTLTWKVNDTIVSISAAGLISDNPTRLEVGAYSIKANVTDGWDWASVTILYTIQNRAPAFTQVPGNMSVYVSEPWSIQINATDADGDTIIWGINDTAQVALTQSGVFSSGTMAAGVTNYRINITDLATTTPLLLAFRLTALATPTWSAITGYEGNFGDSRFYWLDLQDYYSGNTTAPTFSVSSSAPTLVNCELVGSLAYINVVSGAPAVGACTFSATEGVHPVVTSSAVSVYVKGVSGGTGGGPTPPIAPATTPPVAPVVTPAPTTSLMTQAALSPFETITNALESNKVLTIGLILGGLALYMWFVRKK